MALGTELERVVNPRFGLALQASSPTTSLQQHHIRPTNPLAALEMLPTTPAMAFLPFQVTSQPMMTASILRACHLSLAGLAAVALQLPVTLLRRSRANAARETPILAPMPTLADSILETCTLSMAGLERPTRALVPTTPVCPPHRLKLSMTGASQRSRPSSDAQR
jgi:hypothetical protein